MKADKARVIVLISGNGSNLQSLIDACANADYPAAIAAVISNKADAYGLKRAQNAGIETCVITHSAYSGREAFDLALAEQIDRYAPDIVVLAGFMRILGENFVNRYLGRLINIHPSLLPSYPGLHTHQRVLQNGDKQHGASVHFVIPELDAGPVIVQGALQIHSGDTPQSLAQRVLEIEHQIYPLAVEWLASDRIEYRDNLTLLDGEPLTAKGYQIHYNNSGTTH